MTSNETPRLNLTLDWHPTPKAFFLLVISLMAGMPTLYTGVTRNWFRVHNGTEAFTVASGPFQVVTVDDAVHPGDPLLEVHPGEDFSGS
jgi:hypothetical protein